MVNAQKADKGGMRQGRRRGVRASWRVCCWPECKAAIVAPNAQLCAEHFRARDYLERRLAHAQLELKFPPRSPAPVVLHDPLPASEQYQLAFHLPRPRLRGSRIPQVQVEETFEEAITNIKRELWQERALMSKERRDRIWKEVLEQRKKNPFPLVG
jgi:hypothetical protein